MSSCLYCTSASARDSHGCATSVLASHGWLDGTVCEHTCISTLQAAQRPCCGMQPPYILDQAHMLGRLLVWMVCLGGNYWLPMNRFAQGERLGGNLFPALTCLVGTCMPVQRTSFGGIVFPVLAWYGLTSMTRGMGELPPTSGQYCNTATW
jgi:hypothetical protein